MNEHATRRPRVALMSTDVTALRRLAVALGAAGFDVDDSIDRLADLARGHVDADVVVVDLDVAGDDGVRLFDRACRDAVVRPGDLGEQRPSRPSRCTSRQAPTTSWMPAPASTRSRSVVPLSCDAPARSGPGGTRRRHRCCIWDRSSSTSSAGRSVFTAPRSLRPARSSCCSNSCAGDRPTCIIEPASWMSYGPESARSRRTLSTSTCRTCARSCSGTGPGCDSSRPFEASASSCRPICSTPPPRAPNSSGAHPDALPTAGHRAAPLPSAWLSAALFSHQQLLLAAQ